MKIVRINVILGHRVSDPGPQLIEGMFLWRRWH